MDFLGGPVVGILHSQCRATEFDPWLGTKISHATHSAITKQQKVNYDTYRFDNIPFFKNCSKHTAKCKIHVLRQIKSKIKSGCPF